MRNIKSALHIIKLVPLYSECENKDFENKEIYSLSGVYYLISTSNLATVFVRGLSPR